MDKSDKDKFIKEIIAALYALREGNMMLDNEPIEFVKGYETAIEEAVKAVNKLIFLPL